MTNVQIVTGSPNADYGTAGGRAYIESGALMTSAAVKTYSFGVLVSNAGGVVVSNSAQPIFGELVKLRWDNHDTASTGSLFVQVTTPFVETLGSIAATNADAVVYFDRPSQGNAAAARFPIVADVVTISGGGWGNALSGAAVIYYR